VSDANRGRVLKHATRAARRTRVLVLGLIRTCFINETVKLEEKRARASEPK